MFLLVAVLMAQGGPPLLTDDPGTPGDGRSEFNLAFTAEKFRGDTLYEAPLLDFNYGIGERIQLKVELPWLFRDETPGPVTSGLGNLLLGFKYRFLDEETSSVDLSAYPQAEVHTAAHSRRVGLVEQGLTLLLPVQVARDFGSVAVNAELGYRLVEEGVDTWVWGLALGHALAEGLEVLGELHGESETGFHRAELIWNVGARIRLSKLNSLLVSAGRGIRGESAGEPSFQTYVGLQFNV